MTPWCPLLGLPETTAAESWFERLVDRLGAFAHLLVHDSAAQVDLLRLVPTLLGAWFLANVVVSPLSLLLLRALRGASDLRRVLTVNCGIAALQVVFFALAWIAIEWGDRSTDWSVLFMSLVAGSLAAKWGFQRPLLACAAYAVAQALFSLALLFAIVAALAEAGQITV